MIRPLVLAALASVTLFPSAAAQDADFGDPPDVATMTLTTALAELAGSGTFVLAGIRGVVPTGAGLGVAVDVPLVFGDAGTLLGNPFVGVVTGTGSGEFSGRLGVRLPVATGESGLVGVFSDFERAEAYVPDLMSVSAALQYRQEAVAPLLFRVRLEPTLTYLVASGAAGDRTDFFLDYGAQIGYDDATTEAAVALTGRALLSASGGDLGSRTVHQVTLSTAHRLGRVRPGVFMRLPVDSDLSEVFEYVLGVAVRLDL